MAKRFHTQTEMDAFLEVPRLAMLIYPGSRSSPTGVPVWFDWDGEIVRMFAGRRSPKVSQLTNNPNISVIKKPTKTKKFAKIFDNFLLKNQEFNQ